MTVRLTAARNQIGLILRKRNVFSFAGVFFIRFKPGFGPRPEPKPNFGIPVCYLRIQS
jgi:hypothetical protein